MFHHSHHHHESRGRDMTRGSIHRHLIGFTMPILLSQVFQLLYNTADTFIVGRFLGTEALAAVSSSGTLIYLMVSFCDGTAMGAGVVISRYFGAGKRDAVSRAIHTNIAFALISGVLLTAVGVIFTPTLLVWMKTDPSVMPQAAEYFRWYFAGSLSMVMYNSLRSIMTAVGDSRRPLFYLIVSSLLNVILDILFVGVFGWGVWSAALATVISQAVSVILCFIRLLKKGEIFSVDLRRIRLHWDMLRQIIKFGLPAGIQNSAIGIANVIVQTHINSFGATATAAFGIHSKIESFIILPGNSCAMAITTFISQNLGAKEYERAKRGAKFGIKLTVLLTGVIGICYFLFAPALIGMFDSSAGVMEYGLKQARVEALGYFLVGYSYAIASICRGSGKAFVPMFIMLFVWCAVRIVYITVTMALFGDIVFIYTAYPVTWVISSAVYLIYYHKSDWVHGFEH